MSKSDTMNKLFWSIYNDLGALDKLKVLEKMVRQIRTEYEKVASKTKA